MSATHAHLLLPDIVFSWGGGNSWSTNSTKYHKEQISRENCYQNHVEVSWDFYCLMHAVATGCHFSVKRCCPTSLSQNSLKFIENCQYLVSALQKDPCSQEISHHTLLLQEKFTNLSAEWIPEVSSERESQIKFSKAKKWSLNQHEQKRVCNTWKPLKLSQSSGLALTGQRSCGAAVGGRQDSDRGLLFPSVKTSCAQVQWISRFSVNSVLTVPNEVFLITWKILVFYSNIALFSRAKKQLEC